MAGLYGCNLLYTQTQYFYAMYKSWYKGIILTFIFQHLKVAGSFVMLSINLNLKNTNLRIIRIADPFLWKSSLLIILKFSPIFYLNCTGAFKKICTHLFWLRFSIATVHKPFPVMWVSVTILGPIVSVQTFWRLLDTNGQTSKVYKKIKYGRAYDGQNACWC